MAKTPKSFNDLTKDELIRSALEDFAIDLSEDETANKGSVIAAFAESNIVWNDYVAQHPEVAPEPAPVAVTSNAPSHGTVGEGTVEGFVTPVEVEEVVVVQPVGVPADKMLLKMLRENPVFQTRGYEFTDEHPYALVSGKDAEWILENEEGFRQAFPQELAEFYG